MCFDHQKRDLLLLFNDFLICLSSLTILSLHDTDTGTKVACPIIMNHALIYLIKCSMFERKLIIFAWVTRYSNNKASEKPYQFF